MTTKTGVRLWVTVPIGPTISTLAAQMLQEQGISFPIARRRSLTAIPTAAGTSGSGGQRPPTRTLVALAQPDEHGPHRPIQPDDAQTDIVVVTPITKNEEDHDYGI